MSEENQPESEPTVVNEAVTKGPHIEPLCDGVNGLWIIAPVSGQGFIWIAAVSLAVAVKVAQLAYPNSTVGTPGYAKNRPCGGERVLIQVPPVEVTDKTDPKDVREAKRRGDINYECRCY